ncbi:MAG TPA: ATP synthase subunit I [Acidimicrobiales bacterium]|nr:ATP synthase subunit I [Acidimicrobiales bacterium]
MSAADRQMPVPDAPEVERELAFDMVKRGVWVAPAILALATVVWGLQGTASAAVAITLVGINLVLAALGLSWAAKISLTAIMAVSLGGFAVRMALVCAVLLAVRHESWINLTALGITVLVTHLGLLFWELRYVSASLAFPGLRPAPTKEALPS